MIADFGIFGGDGRSCYLAAELLRRGHRVAVYSLSQESGAKAVLREAGGLKTAGSLRELVQSAPVLAGPVPFSRYIRKEAAEESCGRGSGNSCSDDLTQEELLRCLAGGQRLFAGQLPAEFTEKAEAAGVSCVDFLKEEAVLSENAVLTAQGCLAEILRAWPGKLAAANVLVLGYGCCGSEIAGMLGSIGARVTVCVRRVESAWKAAQRGLCVCYAEGLAEELGRQDVIINTVPARLLGIELLKKLRRGALLVEIASQPGGFSPGEARECGVNAIFCPGLPGKYCPLGAAAAMADCLCNCGSSQAAGNK
ncbi:MAG: hypothetical protein K2N94_00975 [Lachnospiraceae bacterium]|nr:hypothetical protein [Lachnospiraceae bacterium]